jgi:hypothetical protein
MRIEYAGSVHDEEEIAAVTSVLRGGATAMRIGKHVREMVLRYVRRVDAEAVLRTVTKMLGAASE